MPTPREIYAGGNLRQRCEDLNSGRSESSGRVINLSLSHWSTKARENRYCLPIRDAGIFF